MAAAAWLTWATNDEPPIVVPSMYFGLRFR